MFPRSKSSNNYVRKSPLYIQREMLNKILTTSQGGPRWKILIFDNCNRQIVSSQLKMKDLRHQNITLYLNLTEKREQIHGVTILYLIEPTTQNIELIAEDLLKDRYTSIQIHFSSEPSADILRNFAKKFPPHRTSLIARILKIEYSCLNYNCVDESMTILSDQTSIVNLLRALSITPIFVYNCKNAESGKLVKNLRNKLQDNEIGLTQKSKEPLNDSNTNAIFYIFAREDDLFPPLAHGITYSGLMESIYQINKFGNRILDSSSKPEELSLQDEIWLQRKNYLLSQLKLDEEWNHIKAKRVSHPTHQYSETNEKEVRTEWHVNCAGKILVQGKERRLNQFHQIEKEIYSKGLLSKDSLMDAVMLLKEATESKDKTRFMMIALIFLESLDEICQLEKAFPEIKKVGKYNELKEKRLKGVVAENATNKYIKKFAKGLWKNLTADDKKYRLTKQVEKVKNSEFSQMMETGLTVECLKSLPKNRTTRIIVYCLGGVCFHEHGNLIKNDPDCIYSGDKMVSFRDFV